MSKLIINGGARLEGTVKIDGAKNAALAIIAAAIMAEGETILENVPRINDVVVMTEILEFLGARINWLGRDCLSISVPDSIDYVAAYHQVKRIRASNLLLGSLVARKKITEIALPGGCQIGSRPMDLHIKGLEKLGCKVTLKNGFIKAECPRMIGSRIYLDFPSVGATENIMMAASVAEGSTILENVAKEPEIVDMANFLNAMGAKIRGAGTDVIRIDGVKSLHGIRYGIIPDRIEAGTIMVGAAITRGNVVIENVIPTHLKPVVAKLQEAGVHIEESDCAIRVIGSEKIRPVDIKTLPYPGFPTDMQSQMMALLTLAEGTSVIVENIFENRLQVASELRRMGAKIKIEGRTAVVIGVPKLLGTIVKAPDLRGGAGLILAALAAEGKTEVHNLGIIDRGYINIEEKFRHLGADVIRMD
ncbi:MAG: UDP-N-acetylglucosamine 1-carboxyvinyltransferase [Bacillota bacterium]